MPPQKTYDVLILGCGPAGLSAASATVRQNHSTLLLDSGKYRNEDSKHMHAVCGGWDHKDPAEFRKASLEGYERYGCVDVERGEVESIVRADEVGKDGGDGKGVFEVRGKDGRVWRAWKVILATGVEDLYPDIEGYAECWVSGIFHCLYCHGWEEKGAASSGVLAIDDCGTAPVAMHVARQSLRLTDSVTMYTHGNDQLAADIRAATRDPSVPQMKADARRIVKFEKGPHRAEVTIHFEDGTTATETFIAHKPKFRLRGDLHEKLGLEVTPQGTLKVTPPFNQTNVPGVFACGDIVTPMQTVMQALYSGGGAGAGATVQLQAEQLGQKSLF